MRLDVAITPAELGNKDLTGTTAVVIDVLRATTTMAAACVSGCRAIIPVGAPEEAQRLATELRGKGQEVVLGGERQAQPLPGFDLENSPLQYTSAAVKDKTVVMTTTNGTGAFLAAKSARKVYAACFLNLDAVVQRCRLEERVVIICAGRHGRASVEDTVCAGELVNRLTAKGHGEPAVELGDGAALARWAAQKFAGDAEGVFAASEHGRYLQKLGRQADLAYAAQTNKVQVVPVGEVDAGILVIKAGEIARKS